MQFARRQNQKKPLPNGLRPPAFRTVKLACGESPKLLLHTQLRRDGDQNLKDVPKQFLNRTTLTIKNYTGGTPIGAAVHKGHADQLPAEFRPQPPTLVQRMLYKTGFFRPPYA